ncbi:ammonium transporter mep1 [Botrytis cinerea]
MSSNEYYPNYGYVGAPANYNGTGANGGDSAVVNLNQWFDPGDQAFIIVASCMVLLMPPGLGFLYSGLARRKSALSMIWACMGAFSIIVFQWYFWVILWLLVRRLRMGILLQFCATTAAIVVGAVAERGRLVPMMVFIFFWATIVYCPVACWVWNVNGWGFKYGVLDYAGGGPVEIVSGMSALAYSMVLGKRQEKMMLNFRPHNVSLITLGTILLWFGWLGFNGGSAFGANLRAVMACWNSCLAAMFGSITWCLLDWRLARKWSMVGWCSGCISGLVAATPTSGFIPPWASVILGIVTGIVCNYSTKIKFWIRIDDSMDVLAEHGMAGVVGLVFNAFFAADYIIGLDGVNTGIITGGWLNHNYKQLYIQIAYIVACTAYSFVVSAILAIIINYIPGLHLRASEEAELLGMDDDQLGEFAYDYVEVRRDYLAWTPAKDEPENVESNGGKRSYDDYGDRHGIAATDKEKAALAREA